MSPHDNAAWHFLHRHLAEGRGDRLAFQDPHRRLTYAALAAAAARFAAALHAAGIGHERRIALVLLDTVDFPVAFWGALTAGVVPVPVNTMLTPDQTAYILADSRAEALVVSAPLAAPLRPLLGQLPALRQVVVAAPDGTTPTLNGPVLDGPALTDPVLGAPALNVPPLGAPAFNTPTPDGPTRDGPASNTPTGTAVNEITWDAFLATGTAPRDPVAVSPDEVAFWLYSSGSTGLPKGARHVHSSLRATADTYAAQVLGIAADDLVFSAAKLFFAYGLGNAMTFPMAVGASAVLLPDRPTPDAVLATMTRFQP
ncbi:MAG: AMP-binding protein, partial [Acetobacteraceae bacterium]